MANTIKLTGQVISSTNYTTNRLFNFSPELLQQAAENFMASGVTQLEIPEAVLDPDNKSPDTGIDEPTLRKTVKLLPKQTKVTGSYLGGAKVESDADIAAYLDEKKRTLDLLLEHFPHFTYTMLHPIGPRPAAPDMIKKIVDAWAELAQYTARQKKGFQCCLHNHYDSNCETAEQVSRYLDALQEKAVPNLRWGPDTGHCHGMGDRYLEVFEKYAALIGNYFHIKARIPAFDKSHGGELYNPDRDIWGNKAEFGTGLYSGFVNCADPEIQTPFDKVFSIIRASAQPVDSTVCGAMEIDIPRQHPRLEIMCSVLYLKRVHGIEPDRSMTYQEIIESVFEQSIAQ